MQWYTAGGKDYSYKTFRNYLNMVFTYAGTASLSKELLTIPYMSLQPGDVFIKGGSPGHAVIVVDVATIRKQKRKFFIGSKLYACPTDSHFG